MNKVERMRKGSEKFDALPRDDTSSAVVAEHLVDKFASSVSV